MVEDLIPLDFFCKDGEPMGGSAMSPHDLINMVYYYERRKFDNVVNECVEKATKEGLLVKSECGNYFIFNWPKEA